MKISKNHGTYSRPRSWLLILSFIICLPMQFISANTVEMIFMEEQERGNVGPGSQAFTECVQNMREAQAETWDEYMDMACILAGKHCDDGNSAEENDGSLFTVELDWCTWDLKLGTFNLCDDDGDDSTPHDGCVSIGVGPIKINYGDDCE